MRISDWSSDVCSSDLGGLLGRVAQEVLAEHEAAVLKPAQADQESERACAARQARGFSVDESQRIQRQPGDRTRVVSGKSGAVRVDLGGRRIIKKKHETTDTQQIKQHKHKPKKT